MQDQGDLVEMGTIMLESLEMAGFPDDRQNFVPHLTIGRIKQIRNNSIFQSTINRFKDGYMQETLVNEIILFESVLKPKGPQYYPLKKYPLGSIGL
jgi:2'-5' RNA ligase